MEPKKLIGLKIVDVRTMTNEEMEAEGWSDRYPPSVLVLEDGTKLYPSRDHEGNGAGAMFGISSNNGEHFQF